IMGYHYSKEEGEPEEVSMAIMEHYLPRYAGDRPPDTKLGTILSLADKFDSLCACFSIGLVPTGSQDPYALRRQAQGIVRILGDKRLPLSLQEAVTAALENFPGAGAATREILDFFRDRLYQTFLERGYRYDILNAVLGAGFDNIGDFCHRLEVITQFSKTPEWQGLVTVVERTFNIGKDSPSMGEVEEGLLQEIEERRLWETYLKNKDHILSLINAERYEEASREYYTAFAQTVHTFFDKVFVNVEDTRLRNNRLLLIKNINELYSKRIADLSQIVPPVAPGDGQ
ncbi:MAG: glycine--tRNA ligase subunit beta, partial [Candidatus Brocadiales bacterium]|nr:glycine--tRNA ligase subunit beta [Candidatus Brocadiales bacterium]